MERELVESASSQDVIYIKSGDGTKGRQDDYFMSHVRWSEGS
jgi:hypothetical protein